MKEEGESECTWQDDRRLKVGCRIAGLAGSNRGDHLTVEPGSRVDRSSASLQARGPILHPSSFILALPPEFAKITDQAGRTRRLARGTHVTPVQDQPMVGVLAVLLRDELHQ